MRIRPLLHVLSMAMGLVAITLTSLIFVQQISLAQGSAITMTKVLNKSSNTVRVGEVLSFTIALTNTSGFTFTNVTVIDDYDTSVLAFARAEPPQDTLDTGAGTITWLNVATPAIPPGGSFFITVVFTAEHPKPTVVNAARSQDLVLSSGAISDTANASETQESIGGSAPLLKSLLNTDSPQVGDVMTFTHVISNDGLATLTRLPLSDTYNSLYLEFVSAVPTPTVMTPVGLLQWADLTNDFGDIPPFGTVVVTTVFVAKTDVLTTFNEASTAGAQDEYANDLAPGAALVPILIIGPDTADPTATPTPTATPFVESDDDDDDDGGAASGQATATPVATGIAAIATASPTVAAVEATATSAIGITTLPETGLGPSTALSSSPSVPSQRQIFVVSFALLVFIWIIYRQ